jgi:hypothetical protein
LARSELSARRVWQPASGAVNARTARIDATTCVMPRCGDGEQVRELRKAR